MASHAAVVINAAEEVLGELRVRACAARAERLLAWATPSHADLGGRGRRQDGAPVGPAARISWRAVLDVQPKLGAAAGCRGPLAHRSGAFGLTIV